MGRIDDADAVLDARMHLDGVAVDRPAGRSSDPARVVESIAIEGTHAAMSLAQIGGGMLDLRELFLQAFLCGLAAGHAEGLEWAEWLLTSRIVPAVDLGIARASARRIAAGTR